MNKYIFKYNLLSSPAVILCSKCALILSLETQVFQGAHAMSGSGSNTLLSEVILYMLSPQNFILPLFENFISVTSHK